MNSAMLSNMAFERDALKAARPQLYVRSLSQGVSNV